MIPLLFSYLTFGVVFACFYCIIHDISAPPDMSEEDKNMFIIITVFWAVIIPFIFVRRLYKAIKFFINTKNNEL